MCWLMQKESLTRVVSMVIWKLLTKEKFSCRTTRLNMEHIVFRWTLGVHLAYGPSLAGNLHVYGRVVL
jgi:hypothetical protein